MLDEQARHRAELEQARSELSAETERRRERQRAREAEQEAAYAARQREAEAAQYESRQARPRALLRFVSPAPIWWVMPRLQRAAGVKLRVT